MATSTVATVTGAVPAGVSATVRFFQNPFIANDDSRFTVEIVGMPVDTAYWVCLLPFNVFASPIIAQNFVGTGMPPLVPAELPVVSILTSSFLNRNSACSFQALTSGTSPQFQLFNRFTVKGSNTFFNIDLASAKRGVKTVDVGIFTRECAGAALNTAFLPSQVLARSSAKFV